MSSAQQAVEEVYDFVMERVTQHMAQLIRDKIQLIMKNISEKLESNLQSVIADKTEEGKKIYVNPDILTKADKVYIEQSELNLLKRDNPIHNSTGGQNGGKKRPRKYVGGQRVVIGSDPLSNPSAREKEKQPQTTGDIEYIIKDDIKQLFIPFYRYLLSKPEEALDIMKKKIEELKKELIGGDQSGNRNESEFMKYAKMVLDCVLRKVIVKVLAPYFKNSLEKHVFFDEKLTNKITNLINEKIDNKKVEIYQAVLSAPEEDKNKIGVVSLTALHNEYLRTQTTNNISKKV